MSAIIKFFCTVSGSGTGAWLVIGTGKVVFFNPTILHAMQQLVPVVAVYSGGCILYRRCNLNSVINIIAACLFHSSTTATMLSTTVVGVTVVVLVIACAVLKVKRLSISSGITLPSHSHHSY